MAAPSERGHLLVIDDEEDILKALHRQFRRDYDVHIAKNADDGYRIMTHTPIQVIISDQRMPGMSGSEFFSRVKGDFPDAIRLLLTGYADIQAVITAINDGNIFRYITKPWDPVELDTIVREAFERYQLIVQNRTLMIQLQETNQQLEQRVIQRTAELAEVNERLVGLNQQKDYLLGMVAHDLRSPISAMYGWADLLASNRLDSEEYQEFATAIQETSGKMLTLINNLLDISAIEQGELRLNLAPVDVGQFVGQVCRLNRRIGRMEGIELVTNVEPGLPHGLFDPNRIEQVLDNLIGNAFKFSAPGSVVTLDVRHNSAALEFSVADQGQGIPPEDLEIIFQPFRGARKPQSSSGEKSHGLGLTICKRIVELHGGRIGVTSAPGEGSCFTFTLPMNA